MFLVAGIKPGIKKLGKAKSHPCPVCGSQEDLNVIHKYMTPHLFFIPVFRFHSEYAAVCPACASVMGLDAKRGEAIRRGQAGMILPGELTIMRDNMKGNRQGGYDL